MKILVLLAVSCVISVAVLGAREVYADESKVLPEGTIKFVGRTSGENEGNYPCGIELKSGDYVFPAPGSPCQDDRDNFFKLDNSPSATLITLYSDALYTTHPPPGQKFCYLDSIKNGWKFVLKTYIHPTTTDWISISELSSTTVGTIVKKGVILVSKEMKGGDYIDELSCVRIERSALP
jgi:hypothetical protein